MAEQPRSVPNSYLRRKTVQTIVSDDMSIMVCKTCEIRDAGRTNTIEAKADRHAREHQHLVTVWRTMFIAYRPTGASK